MNATAANLTFGPLGAVLYIDLHHSKHEDAT